MSATARFALLLTEDCDVTDNLLATPTQVERALSEHELTPLKNEGIQGAHAAYRTEDGWAFVLQFPINCVSDKSTPSEENEDYEYLYLEANQEELLTARLITPSQLDHLVDERGIAWGDEDQAVGIYAAGEIEDPDTIVIVMYYPAILITAIG